MKIKSKVKRIFVMALAIALCLVLCLAVYTVIKQNKKSALVADANAASSVVGELYNSGDGSFSGANLQTLAKKAGYSDGINAMIADASTPKKASVLTSGGEWSVKFGGLTWNPMYLSQTNDGTAILTLWLASNNAVSTWSDGTYYNETTATKTYTETLTDPDTEVPAFSNTYDGSYIRHYILNGDSNYATGFKAGSTISASKYDAAKNMFALFRKSGGINNYIVTPSNVQWQMNEKAYKNDPGYTKTSNYSSYWTNDKLWIPGVTEVGYNNGGLWGTSTAQRSNSSMSWLRSGGVETSSFAFNLKEDGTMNWEEVNYARVVRPALHLNLQAAVKATKINEPQDFSIDYDGTDKRFTALTDKPQWFKVIADDVNVQYYKNDVEETGQIIDSGEYTAVFTLKDTSRQFDGTIGADESKTVRKRKLTVNKKKVALNITELKVDENGEPEGEEPKFKDTIADHDSNDANLMPKLRLVYKASGGSDWSPTVPTALGTYDVKVELYTDGGKCNYELDKEYATTFTKGAKKVKVPKFENAEQTYTGNIVPFKLTDFDSALMEIKNIGDFTSGTDYAVDAAGNYTFYLTDVLEAGRSLTFKLKDDAPRVWDDNTGNGEKTITFNLKPKELTVSFKETGNAAPYSWKKGAEGSITATTDAVDGDTVELTCEYYDTTTQLPKPVTGSSLDVSTLEMGSYEIRVSLAAATDSNDNKNYVITGTTVTQGFNITDKEVNITDKDLVWQYVNADLNGGAAQALTSDTKIKYNGKEYTVKLDESKLAALGVEVDTYESTVGTAVGTCNTTVTLKCLPGHEFATDAKTSFTLTWNIEKGDYDQSKFKWQYFDGTETKEYVPGTTVLEYLPNGYKLTLDLPEGLKVSSYSGNEQVAVNTEANPHYTAKVDGWVCEDDNYNQPENVEVPDCEWSIVPRTIKISWKEVEYKGANGRFDYKIINAPAYEKIVEYKYYSDSACTQEVKLENIEVDLSKKVDYYVVMSLKEAVKDNYVLSGDPKTSFIVGESKTVVELKLVAATGSYNGEAQGELEYDTISPTFADEDLIIKYYLKSDTEFAHPIDKPVNAGKYVMVAELSETAQVGHIISGDNVFDFEITKAALDMSGVKWGYIDEEGNEVEYDPAKKLGYAIENGQPKAQNVVLIGLPEYLKDKVKYGAPHSAMGKYTTEYHIDTAAIDTDNYELPDETLIPTLDEWEITIREVEKPQLQKFWMRHDGTEKTFELNGYNENYMYIVDGSFTQTEVVKYSVKLGLMDEKNTRWAGTNNATVELKFEIIAQDAPEPLESDDPNKDPNDPNNNDDKPVTPGTTDDGDGGFKLPDGFPLWQVIVGGLSIILIAVFIAKICSNVSNAHDFDRRRGKLSKAYAGAMINGMLFGIPTMWWTVIALSLTGVAVVLFAVVLITQRKLKKAKIAFEDAEDEYNEAEKRRRDDDMKMLVMMLNGNKGGAGVAYAPGAAVSGLSERDLDAIASRVTAALLPSMQQAAQLTAGSEYDDAELRRQLKEHENKIQELFDKDDGFDDIVEDYDGEEF